MHSLIKVPLDRAQKCLDEAYAEAAHGKTANGAFIDLQVEEARRNLELLRGALVALDQPGFGVQPGARQWQLNRCRCSFRVTASSITARCTQ